MVGWEPVEQRLEAPPAQLHLHLLGTPEVVWQGEPLDIPRRQVRAYLGRGGLTEVIGAQNIFWNVDQAIAAAEALGCLH